MDNREIDRLIAEHVFGWKDFWNNDRYYLGYPPIEQKLGVGYDERREIPNYSTDIYDVWLVAEKFERFQIEKYADHYYCTLEIPNSKFFSGYGPTVPLAICTAALNVFGIEVST